MKFRRSSPVMLGGAISRRCGTMIPSIHIWATGSPGIDCGSLIAEKLDARGIALEVSAQPTQETPGPLAEE